MGNAAYSATGFFFDLCYSNIVCFSVLILVLAALICHSCIYILPADFLYGILGELQGNSLSACRGKAAFF